MARYLDSIINQVRHTLNDKFEEATDQDFSDDELKNAVELVLIDLSKYSPYRTVDTLLTVANAKTLDIGGISNLIGIDRVEYPVGESDRTYRNFKELDNETIQLDMSGTFSNTGTAGVLAGTVTFTSGSPAITGSGTAFTTTLATGYFIKKSGGTRWYRVYSITDATHLTLEESVKSGDTGADTVNVTAYRDYVVRVYCRKVHTLTKTASSLNPEEELCLVDGVVVYMGDQWVNKFRQFIDDASARISDIHNKLSNLSDLVQKSVGDIEEAKTYFGQVTYGNRGTELLGSALRIQQALQTGVVEAQGYQRELQSNLNIGQVLRQYQAWVSQRKLEYREKLNRLAGKHRNIKENLSRD
jgi:hypothetical protein